MTLDSIGDAALANRSPTGEASLERELDAVRTQLRKAQDAAARVLTEIADGYLLLDDHWRIVDLNASAESTLSALRKSRDGVLGGDCWRLFPELAGTPLEAVLRRAMREQVAGDLEVRYPPLGWFHVRAFPSEPGLSVFFEDITRRKEAEAALEAERNLLALIASGARLPTVLEAITREVETRSSAGMLCSVLLLDETGERLLHGAAPSLPSDYNAAIHGLKIGPGVGSCGSAAFERQPIHVADIATDPRWAAFKDLALGHGLAACSSQPIFSSRQQVLGTIAMYYREPRLAGAADERLIEVARQIASIAIEVRRSDEARLRSSGRPERLLAVSRDVTERVQGERQLREREEGLRQLANSIPQLAWMAEPDGNISWYNERWYEYTGTTFEQMQGWGWQSVHDPVMLPHVLERWRASIASGQPFEMEFPLRRADGRLRWFLTRVLPLRDSEGRVTRWFGTNTDIDDVRQIRQALEEETRMLELLNQTGMALASDLDLQQVLQRVTDSATTLSGARFGAFFYNRVDENGEAYQLYTLSGAPREAFEKLGHPRATAIFAPTFRGEGNVRCDDVTRDPRYGREEPHRGMPRGHLPVRSYLAVPVKSRRGEVIGGLFFGHPEPGVFSERTERLVAGIAAQAAVAVDNARMFEAEQRAARDRQNLLESERHARAVAERASRMKDEFLATLSHELRTPLGTILGWAHILRAKAPPEIAAGLEKIERSARAQTRLIEDLLDMSRIDAGKLHLHLEPASPAAIVEAALDSMRSTAEARGITLASRLDPRAGPVLCDAARLQQVIWNLLSNALKFTSRDGHVAVELEQVGQAVEIRVVDDGEGIEPEFIAHVFERFRQADASTTRRFGGLGLGLAVVKQIVEMHGGTVRAESAGRARGATFVVRLPHHENAAGQIAAAPVPPPVAAPRTSPVDLSGLSILAVDDQPDVCELVMRLLEERGARVACAGSAQEALRLFERQPPDVMLSDISMPGTDGYTLARNIRALDAARGSRTPMVAMTAFARQEDRQRAIDAGFDLHVAKPVHPVELAAAVAQVAGRLPA